MALHANATTNIQIFNSGELPTTVVGLTICAWVNMDGTSGNRSMLGCVTGGGGMQFRVSNASNQLLFGKENTVAIVQSGSGIASGIWVHVAATYDGTNGNLYADAVNIGSAASAQTFTARAHCAFGSENNDNFIGSMQDLAIWSGNGAAILSLSELRQLASGNFRPNQIRPALLVGYWPCDSYPLIDFGPWGRIGKTFVGGDVTAPIYVPPPTRLIQRTPPLTDATPFLVPWGRGPLTIPDFSTVRLLGLAGAEY